MKFLKWLFWNWWHKPAVEACCKNSDSNGLPDTLICHDSCVKATPKVIKPAVKPVKRPTIVFKPKTVSTPIQPVKRASSPVLERSRVVYEDTPRRTSDDDSLVATALLLSAMSTSSPASVPDNTPVYSGGGGSFGGGGSSGSWDSSSSSSDSGGGYSD